MFRSLCKYICTRRHKTSVTLLILSPADILETPLNESTWLLSRDKTMREALLSTERMREKRRETGLLERTIINESRHDVIKQEIKWNLMSEGNLLNLNRKFCKLTFLFSVWFAHVCTRLIKIALAGFWHKNFKNGCNIPGLIHRVIR